MGGLWLQRIDFAAHEAGPVEGNPTLAQSERNGIVEQRAVANADAATYDAGRQRRALRADETSDSSSRKGHFVNRHVARETRLSNFVNCLDAPQHRQQ